jgi:hypothetical protein
VVIGFEISDNLDWTAVGTMVLAAVTGASLLFGWRSLRQGQREVEEAHRPVLVPVADSRIVRIPGGTQAQREGGWFFSAKSLREEELPAWPTVPATGLLVVPVENIGSGPALRVRVQLWPYDIKEWYGGWNSQKSVGTVPTAIGVAQGVTPLEIELPNLSDVPRFRIDVSYTDVAGKEWWTYAEWVPTNNRYEGLNLGGEPRKSRARRMWDSLRHPRSQVPRITAPR